MARRWHDEGSLVTAPRTSALQHWQPCSRGVPGQDRGHRDDHEEREPFFGRASAAEVVGQLSVTCCVFVPVVIADTRCGHRVTSVVMVWTQGGPADWLITGHLTHDPTASLFCSIRRRRQRSRRGG
jgi:hypothetical protein